jgi:hypothetical protein
MVSPMMQWMIDSYEQGTLPEPPFPLFPGVAVISKQFYANLVDEIKIQQKFESKERWAPCPRYRTGALQADLIRIWQLTQSKEVGSIAVVNLHECPTILEQDPEAVYIGRGGDRRFAGAENRSVFANPHNWKELGREEAVKRYTLRHEISRGSGPVFDSLLQLAGKHLAGQNIKLACYCPEENQCHGSKVKAAIQFVAGHYLPQSFGFFEEVVLGAIADKSMSNLSA